MKRKTSIRLELPYLYIITVFFLTFNAVKFWPIPGAITIASGIGIVLPFFICRSFFKTNQFGYFLLYAVVVFLNHMLGDKYFSNTNSLFSGFIGFFVALPLTYYVFKNREYTLLRVIIYTLMVVLLWTTVATAFFDWQFPGLVRMVYSEASRGEGDLSYSNYLYAWGLSSYTLPHALPLLIPAFVLGIKNRSLEKRKRFLSGLMLLCCLGLTYFSGATGPVLVAIMILFMSLLLRKGDITTNIARLFSIAIIITPFIISDQFALMGLEWVDGLIGGEGYFHNKIMDFQYSILYDESSGSLEARVGLLGSSLDVFFDNPLNFLIGAKDGYGGHSALLDRLASLGIVGFIPFVCLLIVQFRFVSKYLVLQYRAYYFLGLFAAFMMMVSKNVSGWYIWFCLFTVLPFCIYFYSDTEDTVIRRKV